MAKGYGYHEQIMAMTMTGDSYRLVQHCLYRYQNYCFFKPLFGLLCKYLPGNKGGLDLDQTDYMHDVDSGIFPEAQARRSKTALRYMKHLTLD